MAEKNLQGADLLNNKHLNKGTAFTAEEREALGIRGLLPAAISDQKTHSVRVLENLRRKGYDIERYIFLQGLLERNERLFYRVLIDNIEELMPLVYTPTVGQACQEFANIFRQSQGFYITANDKGEIRKILKNWPERDVKMIVVTDGQRILGLGDLGANGMGIPVGKLSLYTACAGIPPEQCLPIMIDVGTNNEALRDDPLYLGLRQPRVEGEAYLALMDEFVEAVTEAYPDVLIQFEDFLTPNAYGLLKRYRNEVLCFNDDIQGTAAVALAGLYASTQLSGIDFADSTIMFLGAGSAATGIADLIYEALVAHGVAPEEARRRLWFIDRSGLLVKSRERLREHNIPYAHDHEPLDFIEAIRSIKPNILIGATGTPSVFTEEIISEMASINERPAIFALSNPTSRAECTAKQAYEWSSGRAIFASGSPFDPLTVNGQSFTPAQGNNAYVFPGIGLGALACKASTITDQMFLASSKALADMISEEDLEQGAIYPPLPTIRDISLNIALAVAEKAYEQGVAGVERPSNLRQYIVDMMFNPTY